MMNLEYNSSVNIPGLLQSEDKVLMQIFKHLSYHDLATMRIVCLRFKEVIRTLLNKGFFTVRQLHRKCLKDIKEILPRRESQRTLHPLGGHYFLLACIEPKIELLYSTFLKFKNEKSRIFIPGKVLDELFRSLRLVQDAIRIYNEGGTLMDSKPELNNLHIEISELISAAIYSFEESVLPERSKFLLTKLSLPSQHSSQNSAGTSQTGRFTIKEKNSVNGIKLASLQIELNKSCRRLRDTEHAVLELKKVLNEQTTKLREHENLLGKISNSIAENDSKMLSLMKQMKFSAGVTRSLQLTSFNEAPDVESKKTVQIPIPSSAAENLEIAVASDTLPETVTGGSDVMKNFDNKRKMGSDGLLSGTEHEKCTKKLK